MQRAEQAGVGLMGFAFTRRNCPTTQDPEQAEKADSDDGHSDEVVGSRSETHCPYY